MLALRTAQHYVADSGVEGGAGNLTDRDPQLQVGDDLVSSTCENSEGGQMDGESNAVA